MTNYRESISQELSMQCVVDGCSERVDDELMLDTGEKEKSGLSSVLVVAICQSCLNAYSGKSVNVSFFRISNLKFVEHINPNP